MGGSLGKSKSGSSNSYSQGIDPNQLGYLKQLWQGALGQLNGNNFNDQITDAAGNASSGMNGVISGATDLNNQLAQGGAFGDSAAIRDKLLGSMGQRSNMGSMYEFIVGGQGNTYIDPLIEQMRQDSARNVQTQQGNNALDAVAAGQSGSSRQAMENAMLGSQANKDLMTQEAAMRAGGYDKDLAMKMGIAQQADTNAQSEQDRLYNMLQGAQGSMGQAQQGSSLLQSLLMGGMAPWMQAQQSQWNPYNNAANILGGPVVLGSGSGNSKSKGFGTSGSLWG